MSSILSDALESCQASPSSLLSPSVVVLNHLQDVASIDSPQSVSLPTSSSCHVWPQKLADSCKLDFGSDMSHSPGSSIASKVSSASIHSNQDSSKLLRRLLAGGDKDRVRNSSDLLTRFISNSRMSGSSPVTSSSEATTINGRNRASTVAGDTSETQNSTETVSKVLSAEISPACSNGSNMDTQDVAHKNRVNYLASLISETISKISHQPQNLSLGMPLPSDIKTLLEMLKLADSLSQGGAGATPQRPMVGVTSAPNGTLAAESENLAARGAINAMQLRNNTSHGESRLRSQSDMCSNKIPSPVEDAVVEDSLLARLVLSPEDDRSGPPAQQKHDNQGDSAAQKTTNVGKLSKNQVDTSNSTNIDSATAMGVETAPLCFDKFDSNALLKSLQISAQRSQSILLEVDTTVTSKSLNIPAASILNMCLGRRSPSVSTPNVVFPLSLQSQRYLKRCWPPLFLLEVLKEEVPTLTLSEAAQLSLDELEKSNKLICHFDRVSESVGKNFAELVYFAKQLNLHKDVYARIGELILAQYGNPEHFQITYLNCVDNLRKLFTHRTDSNGALCDVILLVNRLNSFDECDVSSLFHLSDQGLPNNRSFDPNKIDQLIAQLLLQTTPKTPPPVQTGADPYILQLIMNAASYVNTNIGPIANQLNVLNLSPMTASLPGSDSLINSPSGNTGSSHTTSSSTTPISNPSLVGFGPANNLEYLLSNAAAVIASQGVQAPLTSAASSKVTATAANGIVYSGLAAAPPKLSGTLHNNILQIMQTQLQNAVPQESHNSLDSVASPPSNSKDEAARFPLHPRKRKAAPQLDSAMNGRPRSATYNCANMMR